MTAYTARSAVLSPDGVYRYRLEREWRPGWYHAVWIMLNPSTADASQDDATLRACVSFSEAWGFGSLVIVNLCAYRTSSPAELVRARSDPRGPDNDRSVTHAVEEKTVGMVIAAWGNNVDRLKRAGITWTPAEAICRTAGRPLYCLGLTQHGHPRHPCRLARDILPVRYPDPKSA